MTTEITAPADTKIVLGTNQYGKAEVRLVKITRDTVRHQIQDLNVTSQLHGDFTAAHQDGDNGRVVATDTQKNCWAAQRPPVIQSNSPVKCSPSCTRNSSMAPTPLRAKP